MLPEIVGNLEKIDKKVLGKIRVFICFFFFLNFYFLVKFGLSKICLSNLKFLKYVLSNLKFLIFFVTNLKFLFELNQGCRVLSQDILEFQCDIFVEFSY